MSDTFRLRMLKAMTAALEEITTANGYQHDLRDAVFRGRLSYSTSDPLPMLSIVEPPQQDEPRQVPEQGTDQQVDLPLLVQGFIRDDRRNPTDPAYNLLGDVMRRLAQEKSRGMKFGVFGMGPQAMGLTMHRGVVRPPDEVVSNTAYFWLPVTLSFVERQADPFS